MNRAGKIAALIAIALLLMGISTPIVRSLIVTHRAVVTFTLILQAVNAQDLAALQKLCTSHYVQVHPLAVAPGGGVVGFPRSIHKNFQVWRHGDEVWLCGTNRVGPVYRFVFVDRTCLFDGVVGLLRPGGVVEPMTETSLEEIF